MTNLPPPLSGGPPDEVPLPNAPLVMVVVQVRYAPILAIRSPDRVAPFQEAIRATYPVLREDRIAQLVFGAPGTPSISEGLIWRFQDREAEWRWRVSLAVDYIALETRAYTNRRDLLSRFDAIVSALNSAFRPQEVQRLGVRYVDRLVEPALGKLESFFHPPVLGIVGSKLRPAAQQVLTQAVLETEEGQLLARWGSVPSKMTVDPEIPIVAGPSWIIDLDIFISSGQKFDPGALSATAKRFAERAYTVFRWMVKDDFLRFYGGTP